MNIFDVYRIAKGFGDKLKYNPFNLFTLAETFTGSRFRVVAEQSISGLGTVTQVTIYPYLELKDYFGVSLVPWLAAGGVLSHKYGSSYIVLKDKAINEKSLETAIRKCIEMNAEFNAALYEPLQNETH